VEDVRGAADRPDGRFEALAQMAMRSSPVLVSTTLHAEPSKCIAKPAAPTTQTSFGAMSATS
jgi:hypothetical protein